MTTNKNDDEYLFEDDELNSFMSELDDEGDKKEEPAEKEVEPVEKAVEPAHDEPVIEEEKEEDTFDFGLDEEVVIGSTSESEEATPNFYEEDDEDDEEGSDYGSGFAGNGGIFDKAKAFAAKNSRVLLVVGGVVVVAIVLKFAFSPTKDEKLMASKPVVQATVQQPAAIQRVASSVSKNEFNTVNSTVRSNKNNLNAMQARLGNISAKQADTSDAISQLSAQVQQMQATNQQLIAQVKLMQKKQAEKDQKAIYKKTHYVRYRVQALQEGRAWLMGSNGLTTSVAVGSTLPHYGKVLSIDVDNGVVVTSSGDTIKYGIEKMESHEFK